MTQIIWSISIVLIIIGIISLMLFSNYINDMYMADPASTLNKIIPLAYYNTSTKTFRSTTGKINDGWFLGLGGVGCIVAAATLLYFKTAARVGF